MGAATNTSTETFSSAAKLQLGGKLEALWDCITKLELGNELELTP